MRHLLLIGLLLISGYSSAQNKYEKGMTKAFELWEADEVDEAENIFERIAKAEPDNWLPHYYVAQINILKSWNIKDETVLRQQLGKAQNHLDTAMAISQDNAELMVIQAQLLTNWVAYDGMTYGMKYSPTISKLYAQASKLDPENPRVVLSKAEWDMGSAKYFGKDIAPYCKQIKASIDLFDAYEPQSKYHPDWGKKHATEVAERCE